MKHEISKIILLLLITLFLLGCQNGGVFDSQTVNEREFNCSYDFYANICKSMGGSPTDVISDCNINHQLIDITLTRDELIEENRMCG